jgi:hypothetical protein
LGRDPTQQRRTKQDARHHLANDLRLPDLLEQHPDYASRDQDDADLEDELE